MELGETNIFTEFSSQPTWAATSFGLISNFSLPHTTQLAGNFKPVYEFRF